MTRTTHTDHFEELDQAATDEGPEALLDRLADVLLREKKFAELYDALLMKRRFQLGLPLEGNESLRDLPEDLQEKIEKHYVEICREVGGLFLSEGDIIAAWPYFRAIDEPARVAEALESWQPDEQGDAYDEAKANRTEAVIDIALSQGANPRRGFELVLAEYGVCRAITMFEHQFPFSSEVREACAGILVKRLYSDLKDSIRHDIESHGGELPEGADVRGLLAANPDLFKQHGYHIDISHLQSVIRATLTLRDPEVLDLGLQLAEYGRRLPRDFVHPDRPPFEDFYNDYRIVLQALLGRGVDGAVRYFTQKAEERRSDPENAQFAGEVLVYLLYRVGRHGDAIEAHHEYISASFQRHTAAPSLMELGDRANDYSRVLEIAREKGDLLHYAAALVKRAGAAARP